MAWAPEESCIWSKNEPINVFWQIACKITCQQEFWLLSWFIYITEHVIINQGMSSLAKNALIIW